MSDTNGCTQNIDPLKLVREGTSQEQRMPIPLAPAYAPVDERTTPHAMVFAQQYAALLKYFGDHNGAAGDWTAFFANDMSAQLAVAVVQDVTYYRQQVKEYADFLNDRGNKNDIGGLRDRLDYLFSCCASLAIRIDRLKECLPSEILFRQLLKNLVCSQLAPVLKRLIAYRKGGEEFSHSWPVNRSDKGNQEKAAVDSAGGMLQILNGDAMLFSELADANLSPDWTDGSEWTGYFMAIAADASVYGSGNTVFERVNHIATHNLFTSILEQFLKAYARIVREAEQALEISFITWDRHEPHYALFLAFLKLFEYARTQTNTLTDRHLNFYYREILHLAEKSAEPAHVHLLVELAKSATSHKFKGGDQFRAGKDDWGREAFFANDRDFVANQAKVSGLKTVYRYVEEMVSVDSPPSINQGRIYASPVADSEDGNGAELTSVDQSWHPFHNKIYRDGQLVEISMPQADIGFAVASHYLLMAGGTRTITLEFTLDESSVSKLQGTIGDKDDVACLYTTDKGWFEKAYSKFTLEGNGLLVLEIVLDGADPAVVPYSAKTHGSLGYQFAIDLPVLLVKLRHRNNGVYIYDDLQDAAITQVHLKVKVDELRTLAVSNDFGPVDTSKPFQPFGPSPVANSTLVVGSKEAFQKSLAVATIDMLWQSEPSPYNASVNVVVEYLQGGSWQPSEVGSSGIAVTQYPVYSDGDQSCVDQYDASEQEYYSLVARYGYVRLKLDAGFGQEGYQAALLSYLRKDTATDPGKPPQGPFATELSLTYTTQKQQIDLTCGESKQSYFFHIAPFGYAEQSNTPNKQLFLLPRFSLRDGAAAAVSEAEFYIGIADLEPPQNLALLFQVVDGTADPQLVKPDSHIHWSYLCGNEWVAFADNEVTDQTGGLLNSGIITFAVPRDASAANTLLPTGMHWLRAAVVSASDAVCRLRLAAAQALAATFVDRDNDPAFSAKVLEAETISKLDQPDSSVKAISQPFASFGGRGREESEAFYTRISERLRHKDRAIALWDYERLTLEEFPQIYKAKCLDHTEYEPQENGMAVYRELAPGHVTVVTIPNQQFHNLRDPLRPYTSLGLLQEIETFLRKRQSCFVRLHVRNPVFEEVQVKCLVRLEEGLDETFYLDKLQGDISRYLSPWAFADGSSPSFGGKIHKSVLINFVEELEYVDYVTDFQLWHTFSDSDGPQKISRNEVEGSKAISILVSARKHQITPINPATATAPGEICPCEA